MHTHKALGKHRGFLMMVALMLIVVISFIGLAVSSMFVGISTSTINNLQSTQALYLAESGLEHATHLLLTPTITNRTNCSGLSVTNSLGKGNYTVSATGPFYVSSPTTLSSAINSTVTTLPVASTTAYRGAGRIMIDEELIDYTTIDGTNFIGVARGVDGSVAASHTAGTRIGQYQCNLTSQGGVPSLSSTSLNLGGKRSLSESIQLEEGWAVGNNFSASSWNVTHWNVPAEKQWTSQTLSVSSPQNLTGVSIISNVDAWAVGSKGVALRYNGSAWALSNTGITGGDNLTGVSAISSQEAWACADQGKIYKWTPATNWTSPSNPGNNPNSISMVDTNGSGTADAGWVVGAKKSAARYNGTTWASANTGITVDLNGVSTLSATDAWAVGNAGIFQWNGTNWSSSTATSATLNSVSMIKSGNLDIGWAVGASSVALYYDGSSWTSKNTGIAAGLTLMGVVTVSENEAWAVSSNGRIYEWNGTTWTLITTVSTALNAIDVSRARGKPFSAWQENFA